MNEKKYWFKRRRYGWGWTPVTWQGWIAVAVPLAFVLIAARLLPDDPTPGERFGYFGVIAFSLGAMIFFSYKYGPSPKWRWGRTPADDPDEDL